jgi:hypothetical protein
MNYMHVENPKATDIGFEALLMEQRTSVGGGWS